jgi:GT2 family glycosyltransferase
MISLDRSDEPIASILVLTRDNLEVLARCLVALERSIDPQRVPYEVILLFQEMDDAAVRSFLKSTRGLRPLRSALNMGFGAGNNFAARHAKGENLVFLNDDTQAQPGWLEWLVRTAQSDTRIGAVGSRLLFPDGRLQEAGTIVWRDGTCYPLGRGEEPGSLAYSYVRPVDHISANGLLVPRATFDAAGGFDESFFPGYYEDTDLNMTIRHRLGKEIVYEPRSVILHEESFTAKRDPEFRDFLFRRHNAMFCEKWSAELATYAPAQPESPPAIRRAVLASRGNPSRVLVIDDRVPRPGIGSGFLRMVDMLEELRGSHFAIALYPANELGLRGTNPLAGYGIDLLTEPLREHLARPEIEYDVVVISRPHNFAGLYETVRELQPNATVVYDTEALYHRRLWLQAGFETTREGRERVEAEAAAMEELETRIAREADHIVAISGDELNWLEGVSGHATIDFMVPLLRDITMTPATLEGRAGALFVAGWLGGEQSPNVGALRWYVENVLPRVRERLPGFTTVVTGSRPPVSVECMATDGIVLCGFVESLDTVYRSARVAIAPIRAGAGVKNKTMEALQYGVPVVATAVGAEGMALLEDGAICVTDDPAEFAERIVRLATDDSAWMHQRAALENSVARWQRERKTWEEVLSARAVLR